jgi:hypothetical protein
MKLIHSFLCFFALLLGAGCVTAPPDLSDLSKSTAGRSFTLSEDFFAKQKVAPMATSAAEYGLRAGPYVAEQENSRGTLFRGPAGCVVLETIQGYRVSSGGLWVPKNPSEKMRLYVYSYVDEKDFPDRASALAGRGGKFATGAGTTAEIAVQSAGVNAPAGASPTQVGVGAGIGTAVADAMLDAEIRRNRGKPALMFELDSSALESLSRSKLK